jgi:hypothetical protein
MIDLQEIQSASNLLWMKKSDGKSFEAGHIIMEAIIEIAKAQEEIQADLKWIKRKLSDEI